MTTFIELLIYTRKKKQLTKTQVANIMGWTPMYYGRFENGYLLPTEANIDKFSKFIGISTSELKSLIESTNK